MTDEVKQLQAQLDAVEHLHGLRDIERPAMLEVLAATIIMRGLLDGKVPDESDRAAVSRAMDCLISNLGRLEEKLDDALYEIEQLNEKVKAATDMATVGQTLSEAIFGCDRVERKELTRAWDKTMKSWEELQ